MQQEVLANEGADCDQLGEREVARLSLSRPRMWRNRHHGESSMKLTLLGMIAIIGAVAVIVLVALAVARPGEDSTATQG